MKSNEDGTAESANTTEKKEPRKLPVTVDRDRVFLAHYFDCGCNATEAEHRLHPEKPRASCNADGSERMTRLRKSALWNDLMEAAGLDDFGLAAKARELRDAKMVLLDTTGEEHIVQDNRTQLGLLQTIGKWAGKDKVSVDLDNNIHVSLGFDPSGV